MGKSSKKSSRSSRAQLFHQDDSLLHWLVVLGLIYLLIVGVGVISRGFRTAVGDEAEQLFAFAENPFLGLLIGLLTTALVQSSSTTTTIIVGLEAGGLPVRLAVPMSWGQILAPQSPMGLSAWAM